MAAGSGLGRLSPTPCIPRPKMAEEGAWERGSCTEASNFNTIPIAQYALLGFAVVLGVGLILYYKFGAPSASTRQARRSSNGSPSLDQSPSEGTALERKLTQASLLARL